ncbi:MAG: Uma2 family endonuclease [Deltaproteobacteria bacterium]|nr:Uma2 family endonuclease [Deltaproteobacteria bacterium]
MNTSVHPNDTQVFADGLSLIVHLRPVLDLTDDQFYEFCQINRDLRIERTAQGELVIMPPAGWETGRRNAEITIQLGTWTKGDGTGVATDSSAGFKLPNGATRSPDAAWVTQVRLAALTQEQREKFLPLCPDFVLELRSPTDSLVLLQAKMQEYLDNGARLGFLIDPEHKRVYVYRPQTPVEILENPDTISGDPVLSGFILDLRAIW